MLNAKVNLDWRDVKPDNIWTYAQNKPSLVISDLEQLGVSKKDSARILVARGVAKWLSVRRMLIKAKDEWKAEIRSRYEA